MLEELILVRLTPEQSETAKKAIGPRKRITHALVCGSHGNIFGTELFCRKYYDAWKSIFNDIFPDGARETDDYEFNEYVSRFNMVSALIEQQDSHRNLPQRLSKVSRTSFWQRAVKMFSK